MLNIGRSRFHCTVETPTVGTDGMGAPTQAWATYCTLWGEMENDTAQQGEATQAGPRREVSRSMTLLARIHPAQVFSPAMRIKTDAGSIFEILAVRYNAQHTLAYFDVQGGISSGGVP